MVVICNIELNIGQGETGALQKENVVKMHLLQVTWIGIKNRRNEQIRLGSDKSKKSNSVIF